ncbi:MAG TPA: hypothetical protein VEB66_03960 [Opitutaceae bacterium]|nr:hypothetical protein [Opitutaceae bacterium]
MKIAAPAGSARFSVLRTFIASGPRSIGFILIATFSLLAVPRVDAIQLLPGVYGYGLERSGTNGNTAGFGANAQVVEVTELGDSGPGTLREAVETDNGGLPRIVVFKKSGVINLNTQLWVKFNNTTIAGQTAPYPGIALHGAPLLVVANDVLVQHLRVRPGDKWYNGDITKNLTMIRDAAQLSSGTVSVSNVVFDHCTFAWSLDECVSAYNGFNKVTFNKCLFAEPLYLSIHMDENIFNPNHPQQAQALSPTFNSGTTATTPNNGLAMSGSYHLVHADGANDWVEYTLNIKPSTAHTGCHIGLTGITGPDRGQFKITVYEGTTVLQTSAVFNMYAAAGSESQKDFIARSSTPFNIPNTTTGTPKTYRVRVQTTAAGAGGGYKLGVDQLYIAQNHAMGPYFTDGYTNAPAGDKSNPELTGGKLTMIGNAFAHLQARGPWVGAQDFYFANNVLYNRREWMLQLGVAANYQAMRAAVIGNTFIEGPSWSGTGDPIRRNTNHNLGMNLYVDLVASSPRRNADEDGNLVTYNSTSSASDLTARGDGLPAGFTAMATAAAYDDVILTAGARPLERDVMELRIFDEIDDAAISTLPYTGRPGSLKNTVAEAGGWPSYAVNNSTWTTVPGNTDADGDGYTNVEEWLEGLSQTLITGTYQGENATYSGGALTAADVTGYRATGFVNFAVGSTSTPSVATYTNVPGKTGGTRTLRIRYSNGSASSRTGQLVVNGTATSITFPTTGSFSTWANLDVTVTVNAGHNNTIAFRATGQDLGNIDEFTIL